MSVFALIRRSPVMSLQIHPRMCRVGAPLVTKTMFLRK